MDLGELLDNLTKPYVVETAADGDRLIAMRLADDWGVGMRLHRRGTHRQWNIREITLRICDTEASISGYDVRDLPLGALISEARRIATKSAGMTGDPRLTLAEVLATADGRFGSSDEALAALALEYVSLVEAGVRTPSKTLVERFGGSAGSWTNRVAQSRKRGFLTAVDRGEAGGALTAKARNVLGIGA